MTIKSIILKGIGFGILSTISFATFNEYFVKRRLLMMGIAQTFVGIGSMLLPLFIVKMKDMFGFRGCILVLTAVNCNMVVAMMVMKPVASFAGHANPVDVEGTFMRYVNFS